MLANFHVENNLHAAVGRVTVLSERTSLGR